MSYLRWPLVSGLLIGLFPSLIPAQWAPTNGPGGKPAVSLTVDGTHLYLATSETVYRSRDRGDSWQDLSAKTDPGIRTCMAVKGGAVYLGTYRGIYLRAADDAPWTRVNTGLEDTTVQALAFSGSAVLAGTGKSGHLYRSTDQGAHWTRLNPDVRMGAMLTLAADGARLYAGTSEGIFHSPDNGATWSLVRPDSVDIEIRTVTYNDQYVFARTLSSLYRTADLVQWTRLAPGAPSANPQFRSLDALGSSRLCATSRTDGLFNSNDNGDTWTRDTTFFYRGNTGPVGWILPLGTDLFAGSGTGIYRSRDQGLTWTGANTGLGGAGNISSMIALGPGRFLAANTGGYFSTTDFGANWTRAPVGVPGQNISSFAVLGPYLFTASNREGIFRSADKGANWQRAAGDWSQWGFGGFHVRANELYLMASDRGLLRSVDTGKSWASQAGLGEAHPLVLAVGEGGFFAGTSDGIFAYQEDQKTWSPLPSALRGKIVSELVAQGPALLAGTLLGGGLFRSIDQGVTWTHPLDSTLANNIFALVAHGTDTYLGSDSGLFLSRDRGASWGSIHDGLPRGKSVGSFLIHADTLYASVFTEGIWKLALKDFPTGVEPTGKAVLGRGKREGATWVREGRVGFSRAEGKGAEGILFDAGGKRIRLRRGETLRLPVSK